MCLRRELCCCGEERVIQRSGFTVFNRKLSGISIVVPTGRTVISSPPNLYNDYTLLTINFVPVHSFVPRIMSCNCCADRGACPAPSNDREIAIPIEWKAEVFNPTQVPDARLLELMSQAEWQSLAEAMNASFAETKKGMGWKCALTVFTCGLCICPLLSATGKMVDTVNAVIGEHMGGRLTERGGRMQYYPGSKYGPAGLFVGLGPSRR